jgi:hypothetical protein
VEFWDWFIVILSYFPLMSYIHAAC